MKDFKIKMTPENYEEDVYVGVIINLYHLNYGNVNISHDK